MTKSAKVGDLSVRDAGQALISEADAEPCRSVDALRRTRRTFSREWRSRPPEFIADVARVVAAREDYRWLAYELLRQHAKAFRSVNDEFLEELATGLNSWTSVDAFGRILAGPAWAQGFASDALIQRWAEADDQWLRRLALVCTVALNMPSDGGYGDALRTLRVCTVAVGDRRDMVEKALSWALRALSKRDRNSVAAFFAANSQLLGRRVIREVTNKLTTGRKNPIRAHPLRPSLAP